MPCWKMQGLFDLRSLKLSRVQAASNLPAFTLRHSSCRHSCASCNGVPNKCTPAKTMSALVPKVTRELTRMRRTLRETFGLDKLRHGQSEVIRSVLEGNHTLAIMPTGAGK